MLAVHSSAAFHQTLTSRGFLVVTRGSSGGSSSSRSTGNGSSSVDLPGQLAPLERCEQGQFKSGLKDLSASSPPSQSEGQRAGSMLSPLPIPPKSPFPLPLQFLWFREAADPRQERAKSGSNLTENCLVLTPERDGSEQGCSMQNERFTEFGTEGGVDEHGRGGDGLAGEEEEEEEFEEVGEDWNRESEGGGRERGEEDMAERKEQLAIVVSADQYGKEEEQREREGRGWSPYMLGFHSLWRGLRAHIRAAAVKQMEKKPDENTDRKYTDPAMGDSGKKPLKTSVWAMATLSHWRQEQQQKERVVGEREGERGEEKDSGDESSNAMKAIENLKAVRGSSRCGECGACQVCEDGEGEVEKVREGVGERGLRNPLVREAERVKEVHTEESMSRFLEEVDPVELRTMTVMSVLCDMAYTIPQINPADLYRKYRFKYVTSSLAVKAEQAAKEKMKLELAGKKAGKEGDSGCNGGEGDEEMGEVEKERGEGLSPATAYSLAAAAASYLQSQSMALLPKGGSSEKDKEREKRREEDGGDGKTSGEVAGLLQAGIAPLEGGEGGIGAMAEEKVEDMGGEKVSVEEDKEGEATSADIERIAGEGEEKVVREREPGSENVSSDVVDSIELSEEAEREVQEIMRAREDEEEKKGGVGGERRSPVGETEEMAVVATAAMVGGAIESSKKKGPASPLSCPCEWFCCDKLDTTSRYLVIQGSDSLASWQTNISFDPVVFDDPSLGVMVHRGMYEAAQALYNTLLPQIISFIEEHGEDKAKIFLTGHSLGGSLATLLNLMMHVRGAVPRKCLQPVYTFGSPSIMCGGDHLLLSLGLHHAYVKNVMMHRDLVPRAFACDYPDHVAEVLRRMSTSFRDHHCLLHQRLMYAPMGTMVVLQPEERQAPKHALLPRGTGLYRIRHPKQNDAVLPSERATCHVEVRAAQRAILNNPHPLEILADPGSYGSDGSISRDHDPRNYTLALNGIVRRETRRLRKLQREQRRQMWWPLVGAEVAPANGKATAVLPWGEPMGVKGGPVAARFRGHTRIGRSRACQVSAAGSSNGVTETGTGIFSLAVPNCEGRGARGRSLIASQHVQMGLLALATTASLFGSGSSSDLVSMI